MAGYVMIDKKKNAVLQDMANRQGLDENIYYQLFVEIILVGIKEFERYRQNIVRKINVKNQPEEQKAEIDEKEKGKEQSGSRQQCKVLWRQMVRVSYSHHQNDRSDIGACYHPYGEILDSVKHFPNLFLT